MNIRMQSIAITFAACFWYWMSSSGEGAPSTVPTWISAQHGRVIQLLVEANAFFNAYMYFLHTHDDDKHVWDWCMRII